MLLNQTLKTISDPRCSAVAASLLGLILFVELISGSAIMRASAQSTNNAHAKPEAITLDLSQPLTQNWRYESSLTLNLTPAAHQERVYVPLAGGTIVSLNAATGQLNWRSEMGGELSASPVADQGAVYVASETGKAESGVRRATGALRALGREGGVTLWMRTLAMPLHGDLTLSDGKLFAGGSDGKVYSFESRTGAARWFYDYGSPFVSQPVVSGSRVFIGSEDGNLLALEESTGKLLWHYRTKGPVRGPVANGNDLVYFGSGDGYVYAINATSGRLVWRKRTGAGVQAVVRAGEELLVASLDNFVYEFSLAGRRLWKRRLPGRISSQPLVTHQAALFMPLSSSTAVVLELRDGRQVNLLPVGEEITTSASPIAVGEIVLLTTEHGLVAFAKPREAPKQNSAR
jgi:outer membrane protein assembly factor BamB